MAKPSSKVCGIRTNELSIFYPLSIKELEALRRQKPCFISFRSMLEKMRSKLPMKFMLARNFPNMLLCHALWKLFTVSFCVLLKLIFWMNLNLKSQIFECLQPIRFLNKKKLFILFWSFFILFSLDPILY